MTTNNMKKQPPVRLRALGLMSGTSLDGIDAAIIKTDGYQVFEFGPVLSCAYDDIFREQLRSLLGSEQVPDEMVRELTVRHGNIVNKLLEENNINYSEIDVIGFHGQTIFHDPAKALTVQIGDGALLADLTGIDVVCNFRAADVAAGGEGAPLAPLYHQALAHGLDKPLAVVNIGGVSNITWLGEQGILAFDAGPGNAQLDDWVNSKSNRRYDSNGDMARSGRIDQVRLSALMKHAYFDRPAPKSLDRDQDWNIDLSGLSLEDGAALLTEFTASAIASGCQHLPQKPGRWLICGGGRHNSTMMVALERHLKATVEPVEAAGWRGDDLEAEAFAFLAVRSLAKLPLSVPQTTGVPKAVTGGDFYPAASRGG